MRKKHLFAWFLLLLTLATASISIFTQPVEAKETVTEIYGYRAFGACWLSGPLCERIIVRD
jgi:hypothetical protein